MRLSLHSYVRWTKLPWRDEEHEARTLQLAHVNRLLPYGSGQASKGRTQMRAWRTFFEWRLILHQPSTLAVMAISSHDL